MAKPGRKRVSKSPYFRKKLSSDARIIVALLKKQPQPRSKLLKTAAVSQTTFYEDIPLLMEARIVKKTEKGYALWDYDDREEAVAQAIMKWRRIAYCDPLPAEIADEAGISIHDAELLARKTRDRTGWAMPNQAVQDSATEKLGEVLGYLMSKRDGTLRSSEYRDEPEIVDEGERGLKEHLGMLEKTKFNDDGTVSWSPTALKYLRKNYKLKERIQPFFAVIPDR